MVVEEEEAVVAAVEATLAVVVEVVTSRVVEVDTSRVVEVDMVVEDTKLHLCGTAALATSACWVLCLASC